MTFAYIALYGWSVIVAVLFKLYSKPVGLLASIIAGYLLLPEWLSLELPALPSLNKNSIPALTVFLVLIVMSSQENDRARPGWIPYGWAPKILIVVLIVGSFLTVETNRDLIFYGPTVLPAMRTWDAFSIILTILVQLLPLLLGRRLLAHPKDQRIFLVALMVAGMAYSFLALYEVRMSPQLNNMVYGFFPHSWAQHVRGDGFRPLVFLQHGLWLSMFLALAVLATFGLARVSPQKQKLLFLGLGSWLLMTLILSKSLGILIISLVLLPFVLFSTPRFQVMMAAILSIVVLTYPMLRSADIIPVDKAIEWANSVSAERAESLNFRIENENRLLEKALQRPTFGWGGWGRSFVFNSEGRDISVVDGYWVGIIGLGGWVRYLGEFGLLCFPAIIAFLSYRRFRFGTETAILILALAANLADLIPNATITPLTWLIAGAIWGRLELGILSEPEVPAAALTMKVRRPTRSNQPEPLTARLGMPSDPVTGHRRYTRQTTRIKQRETPYR